MDERCSCESQVGVLKTKFHSVVESTESQTVFVERASSKHPISAFVKLSSAGTVPQHV